MSFKSFILPAIFLAALAFSSCQAKYADLNEVMLNMVQAAETLVADMEKASDAKAVAQAFNQYTATLKAQQLNFKEAMAKYPELKDAKTPPEELKANIERFNNLGAPLMEAYTKLQAFSGDPEVQEAARKLTEVQLN